MWKEDEQVPSSSSLLKIQRFAENAPCGVPRALPGPVTTVSSWTGPQGPL